MNEELKNTLEDLVLIIQDLDLTDEAKAANIKLIQAVMQNPTQPNLQALLVVLEAMEEIDKQSIRDSIDTLKMSVDM
jgi:hypothetical protein